MCRKISVLIVDTSRVKVVSGWVNAYLRKSKMPFLFEELDSRENADLSSFLWRIVAGLLALRNLFFLVSRDQIFLNI
ncbi:hypothetical protein PLUA15_370004 [Pseudomonas lundensis]|uniref:Uncharacterized protein n=1 Tax=Pseudomonas lundensis TaxID=86185 RepID=A0AAX2HA36_9PSED|nr:hypothetical protein PLUA15_370004 [Pseudomonas lundensis]